MLFILKENCWKYRTSEKLSLRIRRWLRDKTYSMMKQNLTTVEIMLLYSHCYEILMLFTQTFYCAAQKFYPATNKKKFKFKKSISVCFEKTNVSKC